MPMNLNQLMQMLRQNQNPMLQNLASMIEKHDTQGIEALARNLMQSQGKDFDQEFSSFKARLGLH